MNLTVDTNVLVRAAVRDDLVQGILAAKILQEAEFVAISNVVLCEFAWVLRSVYKFSSIQIAGTIRSLVATRNVKVNYAAVEVGLAMLDAGGGFADGVVAHEGKWLGGETFVSFDKEAVTLLSNAGHATKLL
jgi:predicted nucleic-acid-binding protein